MPEECIRLSQIEIIDIPDFYGAVTDAELVGRQLQHAIGTTFVRAVDLNVPANRVRIITDIDDTIRIPGKNPLTPGRIPDDSLRALASAERMGAKVELFVTNNVVSGFVSVVVGAMFGYDHPEKAIRRNLPEASISAAKFVGEKPKTKATTIRTVSLHMIQELKTMYEGEQFESLITMYGNAPQDLEFFNEIVSCMEDINPQLVKTTHFLFINFPQRIPGFVCKPLEPLYNRMKDLLG